MSVIIKGMDMPKNCCDCVFEEKGWCCAVDGIRRVESIDRPDWCPLEEAEPVHRNPEDAYREDFGKESNNDKV